MYSQYVMSHRRPSIHTSDIMVQCIGHYSQYTFIEVNPTHEHIQTGFNYS
jgi:hypothetical protein